MQHLLAPEHERQWSLIHRKVTRELIPSVGLEGAGMYALLSAISSPEFDCVIDKPVLGLDSNLPPRALKQILDALVKERVIFLTETASSYHIAFSNKSAQTPQPQHQKYFIPSRYYSNDQTEGKYKKSNETNGFHYQLNKEINTLKSYMYTQEQIQLANEIADALNDRKAMRLHLSYAKKVPRDVLLDFLAITLSIPAHKIYKSRGAYFTSLVEQYLKDENEYS